MAMRKKTVEEQIRNPPVERRPDAVEDENDLLKRVAAMLETIQPIERPVGATAKGRKSPLQTIMIAIRIPETLNAELKELGGLKSRHIERAIMLYLKAMTSVKDDD